MVPSPAPFAVRVERRNGIVRVTLEGELDLATSPTLRERLSALQADGPTAVLIDLRDLSFIDCTGLHALLVAWNRATDDGHRLAIVGATERIRKLCNLTRTEQILDGPHAMQLLTDFTRSFSDGPGRSGHDGADGG